LLPYPHTQVWAALIRLVRKWKWNNFPQIGEIIEEIGRGSRDPEEIRKACAAVSERMAEAYKARKLAGHEPKLLRSALEPATPEEMGRLSRSARIAKGIEQPALVDVAAKLEELQRQAKQLEAHDREKRESVQAGAGATGGLV
jgi:hypothetical protein